MKGVSLPMERVIFSKMHGAGNDFIVIDGTQKGYCFSPAQIRLLCSRQQGIGADGLILLSSCREIPEDDGYGHVRMDFFNCNGSRAELCGNGLRCAVCFSCRYGLSGCRKILFRTDSGELFGEYLDKSAAAVQICVTDEFRRYTVTPELTVYKGSTGVPHAVLFVDDTEKVDVRKTGAELRYHPLFAPNGANVDFIQLPDDFSKPLKIRTYERGVEDETLACGTGAVA